VEKELGFRAKLDHLAFATLGRGKSGHGLEAIRLYQAGKWEELARYCLDDVRITYELYEYGLKHGHIKFPDRNGTIKEVKATWVPVPEQVKLF
jgi:DEAD/DEAH box helicase domain-containing protein